MILSSLIHTECEN